MSEIVNLLGVVLEHERGDRLGWALRSTRLGAALGAARIGGSIYELAEGEHSFPYHFHHGVEEWLIVLEGTPTVRTPAGEHQLRAGDTMCFPDGSEGAHDFSGPGRVLVLSANQLPSISVYPESGKIGTRPADHADSLNFRRADAVDYWDGEQ